MTPSAGTPQVRDDLEVVDVDGELVIYDPVRGGAHVLNPLGSLLFRLLDGSATVDELVADLAPAFGAPPAQVHEDVDAWIGALGRARLLVTDSGSQPSSEARRDEAPAPAPGYLVDPPAP